MSFSVNTPISDGVVKQYPITFSNGIFSRASVFVYVEDDVDGAGDQLERSYTWINDGLIELDVVAPAGKVVTIRRIMEKDTPTVDFVDGAILDEQNLDEQADHLLNTMHEVLDGYGAENIHTDVNMNGNSITNVESDPDDPSSLATIGDLQAAILDPIDVSDVMFRGQNLLDLENVETARINLEVDSSTEVTNKITNEISQYTNINFATVAEMVTDTRLVPGNIAYTKGYYATGDGGAASYLIAPAQSVDGYGDHTLASGNVALLQMGETLNPLEYGLGAADNSDAWQALLDNTSVGSVHFPYKGSDYVFLSSSTCTRDITITADAGVKINCEDAAFTGAFWTEFSGSIEQIEELSVDAVEGDRGLTFASPPSVIANDILIIYNPTDYSWSGFRSVYRAGEFCKVVSTSVNVAKVAKGLYDDYTTASVDVYKLDAIRVSISGLEVNGDKSSSLIKLSLCRDSSVNEVKIKHGNNSCVLLDRCYNCEINSPSIHNVGDGGDDYGISISNSQTIKTIGGDIYSRRHAVTLGGGDVVGSVSCRDVRAYESTLSNDIASGVPAADFHGNVEDSSYENCIINGGATFGGKDNGYSDCKITNIQNGSTILSGEVLGGRHYAHDCNHVTYFDPSTSGRGIIDMGGNNSAITADTVQDVVIDIQGGSIKGRNLGVNTYLAKFRIEGMVNKVNFRSEGLTVDVNNMGGCVLTDAGTGTPGSDFIVVDDMVGMKLGSAMANHIGGAFLSFPHRLMTQTGKFEGVTSTSSESVFSGYIDFNYTYPRVPSAQVSKSGRDGANSGAIGGKMGIPYPFDVNASQIRMGFSSADMTNFTVATDIDLHYSVSMDEI